MQCAGYVNADPEFMKDIKTGDETWLYSYDPDIKTSHLSEKQHCLHRKKVVQQSRSNMVMTVFFYYQSIIMSRLP